MSNKKQKTDLEQVNKQAKNQTNKQTNRRTNTQTNKHKGSKQTNLQNKTEQVQFYVPSVSEQLEPQH